jgi:hypothetical protein
VELLPQLQFTKSTHRLTSDKAPKAIGVKTVHFLDSLIDILKQDDIISIKADFRNRANTENATSSNKKLMKKPKIVRNQLTKMFFEPSCISRRIQT